MKLRCFWREYSWNFTVFGMNFHEHLQFWHDFPSNFTVFGGPELDRAGPSSPELAGAGPGSNREDFSDFPDFPEKYFLKKGFREILLAKSPARAGQPSETY